MRVLVAGVGNIFLGDDGFGSEVVRALQREQLPEGVQLVDYGIRGVHLAYDLLEPWEALVLIDALPPSGKPGAVEVYELEAETGDGTISSGTVSSSAVESGTASLDAHSLDPNSVFASLRALGGTPPRTFVVGAHVESVEEGIGLTPVVQDAVTGAASVVLGLVGSMAADAATADQGA
ncbi:hydrogenase maturation protease [Rhodococcus sp. KBS0724]|uniref:hydrogenase maturation protease n=1 Tax=Rhodococcus sp. KBS0724 TaxID=1179674 RepID=UPI00110D36E7|nr:hydrogenase maturation protease [Rhodococcus sp. KBS0724]TSD46819.1 hydrogenase maturation protease [Rhodococcus sp. KBS0724]